MSKFKPGDIVVYTPEQYTYSSPVGGLAEFMYSSKSETSGACVIQLLNAVIGFHTHEWWCVDSELVKYNNV